MPLRLFSVVVALLCFASYSQGNGPLPDLSVSQNGRYLVQSFSEKSSGQSVEKPFFYLGDTAWELFHRLDREEASLYLDDRAAKKYNVIQAVVLAELDGLTTGNAYGNLPLIDNDPTQWNESYFEHVDWIVRQANKRGMYVGLLPTWGDKWNKKWGVGPEIFTQENAEAYGAKIAERYKDDGIIWILGGDRPPENEAHFAIIRAMAQGIRKVVGKEQLITFHPSGWQSSATWFHNDDWLDFNMFQSSHSKRNGPNYQLTRQGWAKQPAKPILDGEPRYEDHPVDWKPEDGRFDAFDVRQAAWWSVLSGACGNTYGNHNVWQMWQPGRQPISHANQSWQDSLQHPGAAQLGLMKNVLEELQFQELEPSPEILENNAEGSAYQVAARSKKRTVVYSPEGGTISIKQEDIPGASPSSKWWNPRDGQWSEASYKRVDGCYRWEPVSHGRGEDWVLVVDL